MDDTTAAAVAAAAVFSRVFGPHLSYLVEAVIAGFAVKSRWKRLTNIGVGVALALLLMTPAAHETRNWWLLVVAFAAGILASAAAATDHDKREAEQPPTWR